METIFGLLIIAIVIFSPIYAITQKKAGEGKAEFIGSTLGAFIGLIFCVYLFAWMIGLAGEFHGWFWGGIRIFLADVEGGLTQLEKGIRAGIQVLFYLLGVAVVMGDAGAVFHWLSKRLGVAGPTPKQRDWQDQDWEDHDSEDQSMKQFSEFIDELFEKKEKNGKKKAK